MDARLVAVGLFLSLPALGQEPEPVTYQQLNGREVYQQLCARCHGADGRGQVDPAILEAMDGPPRDLTDPYFNSRERRSDWGRVVEHGGGIVGLSEAMPAWTGVLSERQIAEVVEYVKTFAPPGYPQGETNFFRAHRVTKAFVEQEALLIAQYTAGEGEAPDQARLMAYYANRFGKRFQYEVKLPVLLDLGIGQTRGGLGDLEGGLKWALYDDWRVPFIGSVGLEVAVPTGTGGMGAGQVVAVPYLATGVGLGRTAQLQASVKAETGLADRSVELQYALSGTLTLPEGKQGVFPGVELFGTRPLGKPGYTLAIIPKVYWGITLLGHVALSAGVEVPLAGQSTASYRLHTFLLWDYVDGGLWW